MTRTARVAAAVVMTRDRREPLLRALAELRSGSPGVPVIVVDNGSGDGTPAAVASRFPEVRVIGLGENRGATARNVGVAAARTPSSSSATTTRGGPPAHWTGPPPLDGARDSPSSRRTSSSARRTGRPDVRRHGSVARCRPSPARRGRSILGFIACGAVVRRARSWRSAGSPLLFFLGEETVLAQDLAAAGWHLCYVADVVAHHHPGSAGNRSGRARLQARNALLSSWLRRPLPGAAADTLAALRGARDPDVRGALWDAVRRSRAVLAARRVLPAEVEAEVRLLRRTEVPVDGRYGASRTG